MADSFSLKAILSADGSQMSSTFNQISGQVGGLQKTLMGGIGFGIMSSIGGKAVDLVSNGVKAMAGTVMDSGMSFEAAGSQIAATMGKSKSEITDIINEAARLGATTSFTATQAAQGFNVLAMSGLDAQQQIAAMAPVLDLAAAGSYSLENAASQVVGTVKGFGDSFDNAQKYADMFAKGATLASTDVNMLGTAMSDSAALAASYGQKADRTCIALLRLAEQNVTGSEAATAMSRAMADLYTPTDAAAKKLEELGVKVYEDSGEARDFNTVVDDLNKAMSGMTDEQRKAAEATIFTSYGMKAFDKMCVSSTEKVHEFEEGLRSATGSAAAQASEQLNNLKGDVTIFGSAMEGLGVTIFNELSGSFRGIVQSATEMVSGFNSQNFANAAKSVASGYTDEEYKKTGTETVTTTHNNTKETVHTTSNNTKEKIETTYVGTEENKLEHTGYIEHTTDGEDTDTRNYTLKKSGNIGVMTPAEMLQKEFDGLIQDLAKRAMDEFIDRYTYYSEEVS